MFLNIYNVPLSVHKYFWANFVLLLFNIDGCKNTNVIALILFLISDFETLSSETVGEQFKDKDVFFCTLGTTRRAAGSAVSLGEFTYPVGTN